MRFWRCAKSAEAPATQPQPGRLAALRDEAEGYRELPLMTLADLQELIERLEEHLAAGVLTYSGVILLQEARQRQELMAIEAEMLRRGMDPLHPPKPPRLIG